MISLVKLEFISYKSEAFTMFRNFKICVEKENDASTACSRTDEGGEFILNEFDNFYRDQCINKQLSIAYTPQQNEVAESKNSTIMKFVRSMLVEKRVPKMFWLKL